MRRQRHLKQAASRFLRQSLVSHPSREQPCLQMIDRTFPACPSSRVGPTNLSYWIILSRIRFRFLSLRRLQFHSLQISNEKRTCRHVAPQESPNDKLSRN